MPSGPPPRPRALDLYSGAGGVSVGLERAGFDVTAVDINPQPHHRGGHFIQADALEVLQEIDWLLGFDFIWASPPCQAFTTLRHLNGKEYPNLIPATRAGLIAAGVPYCIENVPGAPLGESGWLTMLCGTMFGLQTPDGRAEIRRHRLFETSFSIALRPACQHGQDAITVTGHTPVHGPSRGLVRRESLSVCGTGMGPGNRGKEAEMQAKRAVLCVAGGKAMSGGMMTPQGERRRLVLTLAGSHPDAKTGGLTASGLSSARERFTTADARAAMGISWMPMKSLSQAIPPAYACWIGKRALETIGRA